MREGGFMTRLLLALVLFSIPALADTIDYAGAGSVSAGTATITGSATAGKTWGILDELVQIDNETTGGITQGHLGSVDIVTGTLAKCASGLCFSGGDLDIRNSAGMTLVKLMFTSGTISKISGNTFLNAVLPSGATVLLEDSKGNFSSDSTVTTVGVTTPEPASLGLLGVGLMSLGFIKKGREKQNG
jgi:hypothetical protein